VQSHLTLICFITWWAAGNFDGHWFVRLVEQGYVCTLTVGSRVAASE
jgi:hypothetical protein